MGGAKGPGEAALFFFIARFFRLGNGRGMAWRDMASASRGAEAGVQPGESETSGSYRSEVGPLRLRSRPAYRRQQRDPTPMKDLAPAAPIGHDARGRTWRPCFVPHPDCHPPNPNADHLHRTWKPFFSLSRCPTTPAQRTQPHPGKVLCSGALSTKFSPSLSTFSTRNTRYHDGVNLPSPRGTTSC